MTAGDVSFRSTEFCAEILVGRVFSYGEAGFERGDLEQVFEGFQRSI